MAEWVAVREVARRRGVSAPAVMKAVATGRIPQSAVRRGESGRLVAIELEQAMACWDARTDPAKGGTIIDLVAPAVPTSGAVAPADQHSYHAERAKNERFRALQSELDYLESLGQVVPADTDASVRFRRYRAMRDQLMNIPDRLAPVLAAEHDPARVHAAMAAEIRRVLNELSDAAGTETAAGIACPVAV